MSVVHLHPVSWERTARAVEKVRERLLRSTAALESANIAYAVTGGHAVAAWVETADVGGVRNCPDVYIIIRQMDFEAAKEAFTKAGFLYASMNGAYCFLEKADSKLRDAVRIFVAGEKVRTDDFWPVPDLADVRPSPCGKFRLLSLDSLVEMCLSSYRLVDKVYLGDLADVGLIDSSCLSRFPTELARRLRQILDTPEG